MEFEEKNKSDQSETHTHTRNKNNTDEHRTVVGKDLRVHGCRAYKYITYIRNRDLQWTTISPLTDRQIGRDNGIEGVG